MTRVPASLGCRQVIYPARQVLLMCYVVVLCTLFLQVLFNLTTAFVPGITRPLKFYL